MTAQQLMALCHGPMPKRRPETLDVEKKIASALAVEAGRRLEALFHITEWGQSQVGRMLNVDASTVNKWVQGTRLIPPYHARTICDQSGVTLDYVYRGLLTAEVRRDVALRLAARLPELVGETHQGAAEHQARDLPAKGAAATREEV